MKKNSRKWIWITVLVLVAVLIVAKVMSAGKTKELKVTAEKASKRTIVESVNASGKIYPEVEVKISPDVAGQITDLYVQEGDSVHKGAVLARIYPDIYQIQRDEAASRVSQSVASMDNTKAAITALEASAQQARTNYERNKTLYDQKVISKSEFEQYEVSLRTAEANLNAARENVKAMEASVRTSQTGLNKASKDLSRTTIVAPMDGVISSLKVKKGESVAGNSFNVGTEMMTVADMSVLEVRVDVGENDIVKVQINDSADVKVDAYNNRKFKGVVTKIASSTTTGSASSSNDVTNYEVRIRLDKSSYADLSNQTFPFRPGMNASVEIKTKRVENVLSVPIGAVTARMKGSDENVAEKKKEKSDQKGMDAADNTDYVPAGDETEEVVFVLQPDNTVKKVVVQSGIQDLNFIELKSGIKEGDQVITAPYTAVSKDLKTGTKVTVVPKEKLFEK